MKDISLLFLSTTQGLLLHHLYTTSASTAPSHLIYTIAVEPEILKMHYHSHVIYDLQYCLRKISSILNPKTFNHVLGATAASKTTDNSGYWKCIRKQGMTLIDDACRCFYSTCTEYYQPHTCNHLSRSQRWQHPPYCCMIWSVVMYGWLTHEVMSR